jgi:alanine racemase
VASERTRDGRSGGPGPPAADEAATGYVSHAAAQGGASADGLPASHPGRAAGHLTAEVFAAAVRDNLALLRRTIDAGTMICAVVKADCYGHGLPLLLHVIARGADWLAVATADEAMELRRLGFDGPALMLLPTSACAPGAERQAALRELISGGVTLTVSSAAELPEVAAGAREAGRAGEVHVKIDTGMGRGGAPLEAAPALVEAVRRDDALRLTGLYTHFATADQADKTFAREQFNRFVFAADACGETKGLILHAANSAATIDLPETHLDMVRPGIAIYGYQPSDEMANRLPLRPSLRLTSTLVQVKTVPAGSGCGYGLTHTFDRPTRVGLVPVGYADGYPRSLSNVSAVRVAGAGAAVRGRVSMDQIIVDLTDAPAAAVGAEVEIVSADPGAENSVENLARLARTIPYELTCGLGRRARRILVA